MSIKNILDLIRKTHSEAVFDITEFSGEQILHIQGDSVLGILKILKENGFNFLVDLTAVDNLELGGIERFSVVYHLLSHEMIKRLTVKAYIPEENPSLPSVVSLWKTADWQEREVYDLFGITFFDHPNLMRIFNPDDFSGYPLRKDYPTRGKGERKKFPIIERISSTHVS